MNEEKLLEEIYQNANTGIYSIETILPKVEDSRVSDELISYQGKLGRIAQNARQMMAQAEEKAARLTQEELERAKADCETLKQNARGRLEQAAQLIVGRVVEQ